MSISDMFGETVWCDLELSLGDEDRAGRRIIDVVASILLAGGEVDLLLVWLSEFPGV